MLFSSEEEKIRFQITNWKLYGLQITNWKSAVMKKKQLMTYILLSMNTHLCFKICSKGRVYDPAYL